MKDFFYKIWSKFLTWFGKIKILTFHFLPVLAEEKPYYVTGHDVQKIMEILQPGDVLIRGYDEYLDGKFIPDEKGYSHAGLYVGDNEIIHAAAPCVQKIHVIDFCQADRIMVLRPSYGTVGAIKLAHNRLDIPYDFDYSTDIGKLYCFELIASCYPASGMKTHEVKQFFGLVKRNCYIAKSIYENPFFTSLFEKNKKV